MDRQTVARADQRAANPQLAPVEVDVLPRQGQSLAAAQPLPEQQDQQGLQPVILGGR